MIDCTYSPDENGNRGCKGGLFQPSFLFVKDHGIETEKNYPYEERLGVCRHDESKALNLSVVNYKYIQGDEEAMRIIVGKGVMSNYCLHKLRSISSRFSIFIIHLEKSHVSIIQRLDV